MTRRSLFCLALTVFAAACTPTDPIDDVTSSSWAGEVGSSGTMMLMTVAERGTALSGSGGFSALLVPGSVQSFTLTGTRRADTLDIILKRSGETVHFVGSIPACKCVLVGQITGGDYSGASVSLRKQ